MYIFYFHFLYIEKLFQFDFTVLCSFSLFEFFLHLDFFNCCCPLLFPNLVYRVQWLLPHSLNFCLIIFYPYHLVLLDLISSF